jgi:outer membrane protein assembly factor BamB
MDIASGGVLVDYTNNRIWLGVRAGGVNQPSLHVINSLTGAAVTTYQLGDIDLPINRDSQSNQAYVTTNAGMAYGYDLNSMAQKWSFNTGVLNAYIFPTGNGFIASIKGPPGQVQWYSVNPANGQVTPVWATPVSISGPTGIRIDYVNQKIFVGSSDGKVHQIDVATGVDQKQVTVSTQQLGTPTIDTTANRLTVGGMDGRLCAFQLPLP